MKFTNCKTLQSLSLYQLFYLTALNKENKLLPPLLYAIGFLPKRETSISHDHEVDPLFLGTIHLKVGEKRISHEPVHTGLENLIFGVGISTRDLASLIAD